MSLIDKLTPTNLLQEKKKFFADLKYNPQFIYEEEISHKSLIKHGLPNQKIFDLAQAILEKTYFGRNELDLFMSEGPRVSQMEVNKKIQTFLNMHQLEKHIQVVWSSSFVSRAMMTPTTLRLRLPADFHKEGLTGMMYHEIGTHALRYINYKQQPWYQKKKQFDFHEHLFTEEGLAVLHALIPHSLKSIFIGAIRYLAVAHAQEHSFVEVWEFLKKYIQEPERRWAVTFRAKRGLTDTSMPGGFTKDLAYLQGSVETWRWLQKHECDITSLYFGKLAMQDVEKAVAMNPQFQPLLPSFFVADREKYTKELLKIGEYNMFGEL